MKKTLTFISAFFLLVSAFALTPVQFNFVNVGGASVNAQFTLTSTNILSGLGTNFVIGRTLNLTATNGTLTTNITAGYYNLSIVGVSGTWAMFVPDTNVTLNALSLITNLPTANPASYPGVMQLVAGTGISISPTNGQGTITISDTNSGGSAVLLGSTPTVTVTNVGGTNFFQVPANTFDAYGTKPTNSFNSDSSYNLYVTNPSPFQAFTYAIHIWNPGSLPDLGITCYSNGTPGVVSQIMNPEGNMIIQGTYSGGGGGLIFTNAAGSKFSLQVNSTTNGFVFTPQ